MSVLGGVRTKIARAMEQFDALNGEISTWITGQAQEISYDFQSETRRYRFYIRNAGEPPPLRWSAIVGEILHDLRSALDHLIWQLVIVNGGRPTEATQFPIFSVKELGKPKGRERRARWKRMLDGVDPAHHALIKALQPYRRRHRLLYCPIERLAELSNQDKHRLLIPSVIGLVPNPEIGPIIILDPPDGGARYEDIQTPQPTIWPYAVMPDRTELLSFRMVPADAKPKMRMNNRLGATVGFGESPVIPFHDLLNLRDEVVGIVEYFARLIE